jgi:hypothetical protein
MRLASVFHLAVLGLGLSFTTGPAVAASPFNSAGKGQAATCAAAQTQAVGEALLNGIDYLAGQYGLNATVAREALRDEASRYADDIKVESKKEGGGACAVAVRVRFDRDRILAAVNRAAEDKAAQRGDITVGVMMRFTRGKDVTQQSFIDSDQPITAAGERLRAQKIKLINISRFVEGATRNFQGTTQGTGVISNTELTGEFLNNFRSEFRAAKKSNPNIANVNVVVIGNVDVLEEGLDPRMGGYTASSKAVISAENIDTGAQLPTGPYAKRVLASTQEDAVHKAMMTAVEENIGRLIQAIAEDAKAVGSGSIYLSYGPYSNYLRQGRPAVNALSAALKLSDKQEKTDTRGLTMLVWKVDDQIDAGKLQDKVADVLSQVDGVKDALKDVKLDGNTVRAIVEFK